MPTIRITKENVNPLPTPEKGQVDYFDEQLKGFGVRVSQTVKTYFIMRRVNGKLTRAKIDTTDKITAEQARSRAKILLGAMESGVDPNNQKRQAKKDAAEAKRKEQEQVTQALTLGSALDDYLEKRKLKPKTLATYRQLFRLHLSDWLQLPAGEITSTMVAQRHTYIATGARNRTSLKKSVAVDKINGKRIVEKAKVPESQRREASADGTMRVLRAVLNYTFGDDEELGIVRPNPVRTLSRKKAWYKVPRRRNLIKNSDLPAWNKAVLALENTVARDYLLFLLHTGLRRNEAACLQWQHVDFEEGCFTIIDTKNKEPHTLPLSDYLRTLLEERKEGLETELEAAKAALEASLRSQEHLTPKQRQTIFNRVAVAESRLLSPYVFPGSGRAGYIADPQKALEAVTRATGIIFSCHDLRRTFGTIAESLDLSGYTVKALLNHKQQAGDVTGGYIILSVDRLREPMQKITDAIQERIRKLHGKLYSYEQNTIRLFSRICGCVPVQADSQVYDIARPLSLRRS